MPIKVVIIEDNPIDLKDIINRLKNNPDFQILNSEVSSFESGLTTLKKYRNEIDLLICDVALGDDEKDESTSAPNLFQEYAKQYKIDFGIILISEYIDIWAANILVRYSIPDTFCGFIVKMSHRWNNIDYNFESQLGYSLEVFQKNFVCKNIALGGTSFYFKRYIKDYMESPFTFLTLKEENKIGELTDLSEKDIIPTTRRDKDQEKRFPYNLLKLLKVKRMQIIGLVTTEKVSELYYIDKNNETKHVIIDNSKTDILGEFDVINLMKNEEGSEKEKDNSFHFFYQINRWNIINSEHAWNYLSYNGQGSHGGSLVYKKETDIITFPISSLAYVKLKRVLGIK